MKSSEKLIKLTSLLKRFAREIVETDTIFLLDHALQNELDSIYMGDREGLRYYYKAINPPNGLRMEFQLDSRAGKKSYLTIFCRVNKKTKEAADKAIEEINSVVKNILKSTIKTYYSIQLGKGIEHNSPKGKASKEPLELWFRLELEKI